MKKPFKLHLPFDPAGDQPEAIKQLNKAQPGTSTLLGVTGSGKTFTMANVIADQGKPVLAAVSTDGRHKQRLGLSDGDVREPAWSSVRN